ETARRLSCDARVAVAASNADGRPLGVGRTRRTVPPWLLRILRKRDGGCRFPTCTYTRWAHAHHLVHWARGGPTDAENLILLCGRHHRLVHEEGWRIRGHPDEEVTFVRPDGRPLPTGPPALRPEVRCRLAPPLPPPAA
ncbi:MAG: HNH endonuclease, partial [Actinomycetota bacterium]|nr:HNH endonuclease [Actinomycetota bacterium]